MTQNRKRGRNLYEEDSLEFMPLSKRINNLHINNSLLLDHSNNSLNQILPLCSNEWGPGPPYLQESEPQLVSQPNMDSVPPRYAPELDESQNPYYFNNNKLLFEMYIERMQRTGQSFNL